MKKYLAIIICTLTILVVFFLPFGIMIDLAPQGPNSIVSMVWEIPLDPAWYSIRFFSAFQYYIEFCFFRLFFVLDVFLLISGKYNTKRFILIGIVSEIIPLVISIPRMFILNSQGDNLFPIIFPIPFLMIFNLILVFFINHYNFIKMNNNFYNNQKLQEINESGLI